MVACELFLDHTGPNNSQSIIKAASNIALDLELDSQAFDEAEAVDIVLEPGEISLHDVYLFHGSEPNHSDFSDVA